MKIKRIVPIFIILLMFSILTGCNGNTANTSGNAQPQPAPQPVLFYKTIQVTVLDIRQEYYNVKSHSYTVSVKVKSDEYNLEKTFTLNGGNMGGDPYSYEAYSGQLKVGDKVNCELYSWKQGETVTRRELNRLKIKKE